MAFLSVLAVCKRHYPGNMAPDQPVVVRIHVREPTLFAAATPHNSPIQPVLHSPLSCQILLASESTLEAC